MLHGTARLSSALGGGGQPLNKVLYGEAPPEVQPLTLLYTNFDRNGPLFVEWYLVNIHT